MKTLLVEDDPAQAGSIRQMLEAWPGSTLQLEHAARLDSALDRLRQEGFDLVLLDLGLPDSRGLDTFIRTAKVGDHVPIVILTGVDDERLALDALRAGALEYLVKGRFDRETLLRTVRYAFERQRAEADRRQLNSELERRVAERTAQLQAANDELHRQITERKRAEAHLLQINRTFKAHSKSSRLAMDAEDETAYLEQVCQNIVNECGHAMVWVGLAEQDEAKSVRPVASAGFEDGYLKTLDITWADDERGRGPTGTAIRTGQPCLCGNMHTDPRSAPWRTEALRRGYASSLALPLLAAGKTLGALTIYSKQEAAFADEEVRLLSQLAHDLASGLTTIRLRQAHRQAEERLRQSATQLRVANTSLDDSRRAALNLMDDALAARHQAEQANTELRRENEERQRVEAALRTSEARFRLLSDTAGRLLATMDPQGLVNQLCRDVMVHLGCQVFFNFLTEQTAEVTDLNPGPSVERLHLNSCAGVSEAQARQMEWLDYGAAVCGWAARAGRHVVAQDIQHSADPRTTIVKSFGVQAYCCHPLVSQGRVIGTLSFGTTNRPRFTSEEIDLMGTIADQVAVAIQRLRTLQALAQARADLEQKVTERTAELQQTMQLVQAERQRFRDVLDKLPAYLLLLSDDYHVPFANRFFEQRFGTSDGRRCFEYLFQRTEPCDNCETFKVFKTRAPHHWEWTGPDGRLYDIYDSPFTDVDGSQLVLEVGLDITERRRAENEVRHANAYNRSLVEANLDPLVTIGPDGKITDVNVATEAATGCERAALIGTDFCDYFTDPAKAREGYQQVFREGYVRDYPLELRHRDGHATSVLYNASVYRDASGQVTGVFAAARDITERKAAEQEQQTLRDELARVSRITTAGQLAASLAHELNQPLGAIACNVQAIQHLLAQPTPDHAEVQEALKDIEADSHRAGLVIHQLRRLYRKTGQDRSAVQLNDLLVKTVDLLHSEFVMKGAVARLDLDPSAPPALGNEVEVQQVVLNLITNALESMAACEPGARELVIRTAQDGPKNVRASVRDSGTGLAEEQLGRIFEPFFTTKTTGMGMGLAISRSIVEAHGGRLWAENNPDRGATFHFTLPVFSGIPT